MSSPRPVGRPPKDRGILLPNDWHPRDYQLPALRALQGGLKRACIVWPRRFGKDSFSLNYTAMATQQRVGTYIHMLPFATQARKVVWTGIDREGRRIIDQVFPKEIRANTRENDMTIDFKNGSIWYCAGSDSFDALMGTNPIQMVFSEYAIADPRAWDFMRPILAENGGTAMFLYTPRGRNHGFHLYEQAKTNPAWFCERLTLDTHQPYPLSVVEEEIKAGLDPALAKQEFWCSFDAPNMGTLFGTEMEAAEIQKRITAVPYEPSLLVHTAWDIGMSDDMAIILFQLSGGDIRIVDYIHDRGKPLQFYADALKLKREHYRFSFGEFLLPHDIVVREMTSGMTRLRVLKDLMEGEGVSNWRIGLQMKYPETLVPIRAALPRMWFDSTRADYLVQSFRSYAREFDEKKKVFRDKPNHDWSCHAIDAAREMAIYTTKSSGGGGAAQDRSIDKHRQEMGLVGDMLV